MSGNKKIGIRFRRVIPDWPLCVRNFDMKLISKKINQYIIENFNFWNYSTCDYRKFQYPKFFRA